MSLNSFFNNFFKISIYFYLKKSFKDFLGIIYSYNGYQY